MIRVPFSISPEERIKTIEHSMSCLRFAVASALPTVLVPLAGLIVGKTDDGSRLVAIACVSWVPVTSIVLSLQARAHYNRARAASHGEWNPARSYLFWGRLLSSLGIFISLLLLAGFVSYAVLNGVWWRLLNQ